MTGSVPPGAQCGVDGCEARAEHPEHPAPRCEDHLPTGENAAGDPTVEADETTPDDGPTARPPDVDTWRAAAFDDPTPGQWAPAQQGFDQWMCRADSKSPYSPWADADAPVACSHEDHEGDATCAECDHHAGYKWGSEGSREHVHGDHETARQWAAKDPTLSSDLVFIQREADPFGFVDGDDVRDPDTGEVHPGFIAILEHLGLTYADVSTSGTGVHAVYRGELPVDGKGQATFDIDTEPWGANDDPPTAEIYANKHVCIATGDHVGGTGTEVRAWDTDALGAILEANGYTDDPAVEYDAERDHDDLEDYTPTATAADETTSEVRDIIAAVDDLRPRDLPLRTSQAGTDSTGWEQWDPSTYRSSEGNDSLHRPPREPVFYDHKKGETFGVLDLFACEQGIIRRPYDRLAGDDFWKAVDAAREAGAAIPEFDPDSATPTSAVPVGLLDKLDDDEARRVARKHGVDWPDTHEARQQLRDRLLTAMRGGERTVLDAPTALGKSYTVATEPWRTRADAAGDRPVVQFHETREARDQAAEHSSDAGVVYRVLRGRTEACDCAAGDHDPAEGDDEDNDRQVITMNGTPASQWFEAVCEGRGVPFSVAHQYLAEHNDQGVDLPCGGDGCLAITQWDGVPTDDDGQVTADVIHATHGFAHVPSLRLNTNMVFDERPDFDTELSTDRVQQIVTAYLQHVDAPVETWEQFVATARTASDDAHSRQHRDRVGDAIEAEPSRDWYLEDPDAHTLAPALTRAVWFALLGGTDTNGRFDATVPHEPPRLDAEANGDDGWNRVWLSVVLDDDHRVRTVRKAPDVSQARSVIGLDAHPTPSLWTVNLGEDMTRDPVLDPDARRHWRRLERGLTVVQVGDATRPYTSGEYFDHEGTAELIEALRDQFGTDFGTTVTAASVEADHRDLLAEAGVDDPETMHYGEEKSRDDFATERVGLVSGCIDPGDDYVLDLLAELGCDAEPELTECPECDGAGCEADPDCRDGQRRAHGREFVGDDADTASALLASVRENHVAQAAGRYARDADGDGGALVFVRTDAMPPGYADLQVPGVEWVPTDLQAEIIDTLAERPAATAAEVADAVDCTKEHVRETLTELHDRGVVDVREGAGDHGAHLYRALAGVDVGAGVALEGDQPTNDAVWNAYTWSLAVSPPTMSASVAQQTSSRPTTADRPEHQAGLTAFGDAPPPG